MFVIDITSIIVDAALVVVGTGGITGALYALLKWRPEAGQITVTAAQGAIVVQTGVIENLRKELSRVESDLEEERKTNLDLRYQVAGYKQQVVELTIQLEELKSRIVLLEKHKSEETGS